MKKKKMDGGGGETAGCRWKRREGLGGRVDRCWGGAGVRELTLAGRNRLIWQCDKKPEPTQLQLSGQREARASPPLPSPPADASCKAAAANAACPSSGPETAVLQRPCPLAANHWKEGRPAAKAGPVEWC